MELQSEENGEKISIDNTITTLGRSNVTSNPTVSRRHVAVKLTPESTLAYEVIGKNPILILSNGGKKVCRRGEKGELSEGDRLSLSIQSPSFWVVKREVERSILEAVRRRERRTMERRRESEERERGELREEVEVNGEFDLESEMESLDLSNIDPVQEFGFLIKGHEFDKYSKEKIRPMKDWNWYLDTPKEDSDSEIEKDDFTEEASTSKSKSSSTGKKRGKGDENEDWTGESDEEKDLIAKDAKANKLKGPKYVTRSKYLKKPRKETVEDENDLKVQNEEVVDEDDETLGGFIVTGDEEDEEMDNGDEEEEEEFEDEDDDG